MITAYESLHLLRKHANVSPETIEENGGPVVRIQRRILNQKPYYKLKNETALTIMLFDHGILPWSKFWLYPITKLYELHGGDQVVAIERQFRAMYEMASSVIDANVAAVSPESRRGALFFAGLYLMAFVKPKHVAYAKFRDEAKAKATAFFQALIDDLRDDNLPGSNFIKGRAAANIVVTKWNATPKSERNTEEMRNLVERSGYLTWVNQQIDLFPKLDTAAFNALGVASRFNRRDQYEKLYAALRAADSKFETYEQFNDGDDGDYADFRRWRAENNDPLRAIDLKHQKESPMKKLKNLSALAAIAILLAGLTMYSAAGVGVPTIDMADLRPHIQA